MAALITESTHSTPVTSYNSIRMSEVNKLEGSEEQTEKAQDFQFTGYTREGNEFMVVCDGHGWGNIVNCLKNADWVDIMSSSTSPMETVKCILNSFEEQQSSRGDGSTITMMLIVHKPHPGIKVWWIGDSSCRIYENGSEVWRSTDHCSEDAEEVKMMRKMKFPEERGWDVSVVDDTTITMKISSYFHIGRYFHKLSNMMRDEKINMTRALGHGCLTNQTEDTHFIPFDTALSPSLWRVVIATDGLWNMLYDGDDKILSASDTSSADLTALAMKRWGQLWNYICPVAKTRVSNRPITSRDDIAVAIFQKMI